MTKPGDTLSPPIAVVNKNCLLPVMSDINTPIRFNFIDIYFPLINVIQVCTTLNQTDVLQSVQVHIKVGGVFLGFLLIIYRIVPYGRAGMSANASVGSYYFITLVAQAVNVD